MTDRLEFIAHLKSRDPNKRNGAIQAHIEKLERMSDEDFPWHRAKLDALSPKKFSVAKRLANSVRF